MSLSWSCVFCTVLEIWYVSWLRLSRKITGLCGGKSFIHILLDSVTKQSMDNHLLFVCTFTYSVSDTMYMSELLKMFHRKLLSLLFFFFFFFENGVRIFIQKSVNRQPDYTASNPCKTIFIVTTFLVYS
jgi:hypothetical protein